MPRYLVQTFGCQMNVHDSRRIEEVLADDGFSEAESPSDADVIVFNTCSIREKAEHKLVSALGHYRPLKALRPDLLIVVAGCVAQQEGEKLLKRLPFIDLVLGPDNIPELPLLVRELRDGGPRVARTVFDDEHPRFLLARPRSGREVSSFVTVMKGCDERCSYCIVPYTRGSERYRPAADIVREVATLVEGGIREVTLLGQTVNSWYEPGASEAGNSMFPELLTTIAREVPALMRLRYTSPHPRHLTPELIRAHAELDVLARHVHLPVQSGSDRILRRMIRRYTFREYVERAHALMAARPGLTLSTDVIVGFPGETREDFEQTLSLVREVGFVAAFGFKYSQRPFTPALKLEDDVDEAEKDLRLAELFALVAEQQSAHLQRLVGTTQRVLIEGMGKEAFTFSGRTDRNEIVHARAATETDLFGSVVDVAIERANKHSLTGTVRAVVVPAPVFDSTRELALRDRGPLTSKADKRQLPVLGSRSSTEVLA